MKEKAGEESHNPFYKILIISSRPPRHSAALGQSVRDALEKFGHEVSFLTLTDYEGMSADVKAVYRQSKTKKLKTRLSEFKIYRALHDGFHLLRNKIRKSLKGKRKVRPGNPDHNLDYLFHYKDERNPKVPVTDLLNSIEGEFDAVITIFWQDMLNSTSLKAIYDKLQCPVLILSPDMAPITGGCFYFGKCLNFTKECGKCPFLGADNENDVSHDNFLLKKQNYNDIKCAFLGNSWMNGFAQKSGLFKNIYKTELIIDQEEFKPISRSIARKKLALEDDGLFILMLRSTWEPRKGNDDLIKAIRLFMESLSEEERKKVMILSVGDDYLYKNILEPKPRILDLGIVDKEKLAACYQASDLFLNASYDDAGPSMINQSLMCGTPVVCYDNGAALDVVENGKSGFKSITGDREELAQHILKFFRLNEEQQTEMRRHSRQIALRHNSEEVFVKNIAAIIAEMSKK